MILRKSEPRRGALWAGRGCGYLQQPLPHHSRGSDWGFFVTAAAQSASIAVNARLADLYSGSGRLFCRDALGAAEVRRAYLNVGFLRDRVAVQRRRGRQTASAPVVVTG